MTKLAKIAAEKSTEVEEFSKSYDQQKETFEKETRNVFDKSLQETKNESTNFEEEMKNLRVSFEGSISSLSKQLENAKENTIKITEFRTKEREELMMETEKILKEENCQTLAVEADEVLVNEYKEMQEIFLLFHKFF